MRGGAAPSYATRRYASIACQTVLGGGRSSLDMTTPLLAGGPLGRIPREWPLEVVPARDRNRAMESVASADVLVVEDDPDLSELVSAYLELAGLPCRRALD